MRNVRFWIHCPGNVDGGFVKITLHPDESLSWWSGGPTEEGWSSTVISWCYDAHLGIVTQDISRDGSDCDGRLSSGKVWICPIADLAVEQPNDYCLDNYNCLGVMLPAWMEENAWQRDYAAEAMGY